MAKLTLRVITPDRIALDTQADTVKVPAVDGSMGFLPRHANLVAALDVGDLAWREGGEVKHLFVSGGFVEIKDDTVRIVSEAGERAEEIDVARARAAEQRARGRLDQGRDTKSGIDVLRAELALRRAVVRLSLAGQRRGGE